MVVWRSKLDFMNGKCFLSNLKQLGCKIVIPVGLGVSVLDHPLASGHRGDLTLTHRVLMG